MGSPIFVNTPVRVWLCPQVALNADGQTPQMGDTIAGYAWPFYPAASWQLFPGLIPNESLETISSLGSATFEALRLQRKELSDNQEYVYPVYGIGQYIAIDADPGDGSGLDFNSTAVWVGWISRCDLQQISGTVDAVGTVTARELGDLLDRLQMEGWAANVPGSTIGASRYMRTPPTANIADPMGQIIGNCYANKPVVQWTNMPDVWLFAMLPTDFGHLIPSTDGNGSYSGDIAKVMTRWRLLIHAINHCAPPGWPRLHLTCVDGSDNIGGVPQTDPAYVQGSPTIAGYLNQTNFPEVFDGLRDLTWRGFLDLMIPRDRSLAWTIFPGQDTAGNAYWQITIQSLADNDDFGVPAAPNQITPDATGGDLSDVSITYDASDFPDAVVIEGSRCVFNFTISFADLNMAIGWQQSGSPSPQTSYFDAAQSLPGYSADPSVQQEQNRIYRAQPWLKDVGARFVINPSSNGDVKIPSLPAMLNSHGTPTAGLAYPACPFLLWTNSTDSAPGTLTLDHESATPYIGAQAILRTLSIPYGIKSDGTDLRTQWQKIQPQYQPLRVWSQDNDLVGTGYSWRDLTISSPFYNQAMPSIAPDEHGAALRIEFSPRELLLKGLWPEDGSAAPSEIGDPGSSNDAVDPNNLVATIAMESDQCIRVIRLAPWMANLSQIRRILKIQIPRLQCHGIWSGTIISVGNTTCDVPDRWTSVQTKWDSNNANSDGIYWFRNDWALADLYCSQAAEWAFRPRRAVTISKVAPTVLSTSGDWWTIGTLVVAVNEANATNTQPAVQLAVSTVIESIGIKYGGKEGDRPRITLTTSMPPPPAFYGAGHRGTVNVSPSAGGPISTALGGTQSQSIQRGRHDARARHVATFQPPLQQMVPWQKPDTQVVQIILGQTVNSVPCIQYAADPLTVPTAYNPLTALSAIPGIGVGKLYDSSGQLVGKVLVRHNFSGFQDPLVVGNRYVVGTPISVPVTGGGTVTAYPVIDM